GKRIRHTRYNATTKSQYIRMFNAKKIAGAIQKISRYHLRRVARKSMTIGRTKKSFDGTARKTLPKSIPAEHTAIDTQLLPDCGVCFIAMTAVATIRPAAAKLMEVLEVKPSIS